ncbi:hypothetical protein JRO89_XS10G0212200 [Xanthoceras sorbifolium]|uniref:YABBY N-terminal domain-containing protein n=1 Tax=Xanthoceras sorbifolium TaxID=99658 RepID=A0ABQ8HJY3_9ROSI|nr:hypothetical protein JRO89_XS10G0212200 [Xanthoceras sorbifolium]
MYSSRSLMIPVGYCLTGDGLYGFRSSHVSVPCTSMFNIVTVRCGHCANLLSVNMGSSLPTVVPLQDPHQKQHLTSEDSSKDSGSSSSSPSSSKCNKFSSFESAEHETPRMPPIRR